MHFANKPIGKLDFWRRRRERERECVRTTPVLLMAASQITSRDFSHAARTKLDPASACIFWMANCEFIGSGFKVQRSLFILHAAIQSGSMQIRVLKAARTFPSIIESVAFIMDGKIN